MKPRVTRFILRAKNKILYVAKLDQRLRRWDDERYLKLVYWIHFGKKLDLRNPLTYNEKLQWLKLNYRKEGDWKLVDKCEAKAVVAEQIGEKYIIPTLNVYESVEEIDFKALPDSFVLKCTHDSGGVVVVPDKSSMDECAIRAKLERSMNRNYFYGGREPHYGDITPRIIAEPFLEDKKRGQLVDFKFFCFDGEVKALLVVSDRASGKPKFDYFDSSLRPLDVHQPYWQSQFPPELPENIEDMLLISRKLSRGHPHIRLDLYEIDGRIYFGEATFFPLGGLRPFLSQKLDREWGSWLELPDPVHGV